MMWFVPGAQWKKSQAFSRRSSILDDENALAGEDEEVLLDVLRVVLPIRFARGKDVDADAVVREAIGQLEVGPVPGLFAPHPACVGQVDDEPARRRGGHTVLGVLDARLVGHVERLREPARASSSSSSTVTASAGSTGGGARPAEACFHACVERPVGARLRAQLMLLAVDG